MAISEQQMTEAASRLSGYFKDKATTEPFLNQHPEQLKDLAVFFGYFADSSWGDFQTTR